MKLGVNHPFIRYQITGGLGACVNLLSRIGFNLFMPYEIAIIPAYLGGMTTTFLLSRRYVFAATAGSARRQYIRFGIVNVVTLAQVWAISVALFRVVFPAMAFAWYPETVAHMIGIASLMATSYFGHKYFSFR